MDDSIHRVTWKRKHGGRPRSRSALLVGGERTADEANPILPFDRLPLGDLLYGDVPFWPVVGGSTAGGMNSGPADPGGMVPGGMAGVGTVSGPKDLGAPV